MKLLVLAHTPPPLHGQSVMVAAMVQGLPAHGIAVHHVNLQLSRDAADIGHWRVGKIFATFAFAWQTITARFRCGCDTLYYVPAPPGKRGALWRDWVLMALCRPFFQRLVLHWHAAGLGEWLAREATAPERVLTRVLLGHANLAIVLAEGLRADAESLWARRIAVVPNGIADPGLPSGRLAARPFQVLFLALGSDEKGLFAAAQAILAANITCGATETAPAFVLTAAGPFADEPTSARWRELASRNSGVLRHVGVLDESGKRALFATGHALCLPTYYAAEALPLVAIEALAHDRPVIATRWRGLPDIISPEVGLLVEPGNAAALAAALVTLRDCPPPSGACRARFLRHYTLDRHLEMLSAALNSIA